MARKRRTKKVTVAELQSYIEGAIEFNEDDWCPDKKQWDKLVDMIMNIKEEEPKVVYESVNHNTTRPGYPPHDVGGEMPVESHIDSVLDENGNTLEYEPSRKSPPKMDMRKIKTSKTGPETRDPNSGAVQSGITVKTPDILEDGDYGTPYI